jgi:hypothetical protein
MKKLGLCILLGFMFIVLSSTGHYGNEDVIPADGTPVTLTMQIKY